jgi:1,3-beta-glucan synthase
MLSTNILTNGSTLRTSPNIPTRIVSLEEAVFAKKKDIYLSILDRKEDEQLRLDVRIWASNRFQFVCRTIKGASKCYDGLRFLCKLQNDYDDRKLDAIMKRKYKLYIGAQVYSKREEYQQYCEDWDIMLGFYGKKGMHMCYQRIKNNRCEAVMRTSTNVGDDVTAKSMGDFIMGQGKPCHQSFLLQFFNGTVNECVDCNQDFNLSQSFFIPAVVDEFSKDVRVKIVGFKEYITTMHWSAAGYGAGYTEKVFGSIVQKSWTMLGVRFHYGHPDFVRGTGIFYETGLSKLDVVSEDIFLGIDSMLNGGLIRYIDYYEVGKARDVCIDTTSAFMSKIAGGARHVCNSRQIQEFMTPLFYNPFKQLSIYQTTIGHYLVAILVVLSCLTLAFMRIAVSIIAFVMANRDDASFKRVYDQADSFFWIQLGVALSVPGLFQALVDTGISGLVSYFVYLKVLVQSVFSAFHLLNTAYYFHTAFNNVPTYLASGRTPGLTHKDIRTVFNNYYKTHFRTCLFLAICLVATFAMRLSWQALLVNGVFIVVWMWSPFLFNRGSFSITVGEHTWKLLTQEDWHFVHSFGVRAIFKKDKSEYDPKLLKRAP